MVANSELIYLAAREGRGRLAGQAGSARSRGRTGTIVEPGTSIARMLHEDF